MNFSFPGEFIQRLPQEALTQVQLCKFQFILDKILQGNDFYKRKLKAVGVSSSADISTLEAYRRLPFTTKAELAADQLNVPPYGTNLTFDRNHYARIHQTSGTTGLPLMILDTEESWDWWTRCWGMVFQGAQVTSNDRIFFAFSFGMFIGFWAAHAGAQKLGALVIPGGGMSSLQRLRAILAHEITVLVCTPTYALHLAEVAREEGVDIANSSVRIAIQGGEPGAGIPATRARIQEAWGAKCYDCAGATEVGHWGFETESRSGLYVNEGEFIFEVLDPKSAEPATEGELVITNLGRAGMPVIRYRTGDRVRLSPQPESSRLTYRQLDGGVIGRVDDVMVVRGINVYPSAIENLLRKFSQIGEFAVDVRRDHELDVMGIRVEIDKTARPDETAREAATEIHTSIGLRPEVTVVPLGSLPRFDLKARRFKDHRKA
jgi:phenylacetate-CoA ligase